MALHKMDGHNRYVGMPSGLGVLLDDAVVVVVQYVDNLLATQVDPRLLPQRPHSVGSTPLGMSPPGTSPRWQATSGHAQLMSRNELVQLVESQDRQLQEKEQQVQLG